MSTKYNNKHKVLLRLTDTSLYIYICLGGTDDRPVWTARNNAVLYRYRYLLRFHELVDLRDHYLLSVI